MRALAALLTAVLLGACAPAPRSPEILPQDQIALMTREWAAAYNSRDPRRLAALYDAEVVFWATMARDLITTREGVLEYFLPIAEQPEGRVQLGEQKTRVDGSVGQSSGTYTFVDIVDGKAVTYPARFSFVYRNRGGKWLIIHHHSSRLP